MTENDDPFIALPPGIAPAPKTEQAASTEPVESPDLIELPPGIIDSGTYRMPAPRVPKPDRLDDAPVFFPGAPGLPPAAPATEEASAAPITEPAALVSALQSADGARRASAGRRSAPAWRLLLPSGQEVLVERTTLIGRDPAASAEWPDAALLPVTDPDKSVSKTHVALELSDGGRLLVHDLNSTNGVDIQLRGEQAVSVPPGAAAAVEPGAQLSFGEFTVIVSRA